MRKVFFVSAFLLILLPFVANASVSIETLGKPLLSCTGVGGGATVTKTCTSLCDLTLTFKNILDFAISLAIFIFAPLFIVIGGFLVLLGGGNPGRLATGKKFIQGTVISIIIILLSYFLINSLLKGMGVKEGVVGGFLGDQFECQIQEFQPPK